MKVVMKTRVAVLIGMMSMIVTAAPGAVRAEENEAAAPYRAFLDVYAGKDGPPINVSREAEAINAEQLDALKGCTDGASTWSATTPVADLGPAIGELPYVRLVDPKRWTPQDPGELISQGHPVDQAVEQGMAAGLMTLTAVTFDASHQTAAFAYSFQCGMLCGNGGIVVLTRKGDDWAVSDKRCGMWMSKLDAPSKAPKQMAMPLAS
ncbi:hypothetical protein [Xanthomonas sacchari]|uniref:hypothetical protein n=1 Tax=Xanthomonas sacchari TaxID=56458 RepID=UPI003B219696